MHDASNTWYTGELTSVLTVTCLALLVEMYGFLLAASRALVQVQFLQNQHPAAFRNLSYGLDAGNWDNWGGGWYSVTHSIERVLNGLIEMVVTFWSRDVFPACIEVRLKLDASQDNILHTLDGCLNAKYLTKLLGS